jgi:hypothetical protein
MSRTFGRARSTTRLAIIALVAVPTFAACSADGAPPRSGLVAPSGDGALFGVHPDGAQDRLADVADRLGAPPAVAGVFARFPFEDDDRTNLDRAARDARTGDAALLVTLEPRDGLDAVGDDARAELTEWLTRWNDEGLPVIVRYAHEMNGDWYPWGQRPAAYVRSFREVAAAVRAAPASEVMWAPNEGTGYPFGTTDETAPSTDPYAPYYPGDEHVDWVGLTIYHFGDTPPWGDNVLPPDGTFLDRIRGDSDAPDGGATTVPDFHAEYVIDRDKPFAIAETSALFNPDRDEGADEADIKAAWAAQVFAPEVPEQLPGLDLIVWFEHTKPEEALDGGTVDWTVTSDERVREAFVDALPDWLEFAPADPEASSADA